MLLITKDAYLPHPTQAEQHISLHSSISHATSVTHYDNTLLPGTMTVSTHAAPHFISVRMSSMHLQHSRHQSVLFQVWQWSGPSTIHRGVHLLAEQPVRACRQPPLAGRLAVDCLPGSAAALPGLGWACL